MFSNNIGLNNEWHLPSEPSITQIFARDFNMNALPTPSTAYPSHEQPSGPEQTLSKLPTEREAVGKMIPITCPGERYSLTIRYSGIRSSNIANLDGHKPASRKPFGGADKIPNQCNRYLFAILPFALKICQRFFRWILPPFTGSSHPNIQD